MASLQLAFDILARDRASKTFDAVGDSAGRLSKAGVAIGTAVGSLAASGIRIGLSAVRDFASGSVEAFARVEDSTGAAGVVFGDVADQITAFAGTAAQQIGLSKGAALDASLTFGVLGKAAGLSGTDLSGFATKFAGLAGDLASFRGTSPEQAIEAIGAALRGESEPIRAYGVLLDDASLRQEALAQGLIRTTKDALTPQQKALAAAALITKQTADAQGDFLRTADSTANVQKRLAAETENASAKLGQQLAPAVTAAKVAFLGLVTGASGLFERLGPGIASVQEQAAVLAPTARDVAGALGDLLSEAASVTAAVVRFGASLPTPLLVAAAAAVGALVTVVGAAVAINKAAAVTTAAFSAVKAVFITTTNAETGAVTLSTVAQVRATVARAAGTVATVAQTAALGVLRVATLAYTGVQVALNAVLAANPIGLVIVALAALVAGVVLAYRNSETFRTIVQGAFAAVKVAVEQLRAAFATAIAAIVVVFQGGGGRVGEIIRGAVGIVREQVAAMVAVVRGAVNIVVGVFTGDFGRIKDGVAQAAAGVLTLVGALPRRIVAALGDLGGLLVDAGGDLLRGLANGIRGAIRGVVDAAVSAARAVVSGIKGALGIRSPSKVTARLGRFTAEGFALGLRDGMPDVRGAFADLTAVNATAGADLSGVGGESVVGRLASIEQVLRQMPREYQLGQRQMAGV